VNHYKIDYAKSPTRLNPVKCLVIKAENRVEAIITAYDHFVQKGHNVHVYSSVFKFTKEESETLAKRGVRLGINGSDGITLKGIEDYTVKPRGTVVEG
jgi:hypothetical protein